MNEPGPPLSPRPHLAPSIDLNLNVRGLGQSATLAVNELAAELVRQGRTVFKLGLGQSPFPVPASVVEELRNHAYEKNYLPVRGLRKLRAVVAEYHRERSGVESSEDDVLVGPGSKELMFILQLVYYGDLVIPTPSWVSYAPQAHIIGRQIHWVTTSRENRLRLMPEDLDRICRSDPSRPRIVILNYPANPTGSTYTGQELKALARVARKYRVVLLSDEIYGELHHRGRHVSISRYYPEGTIVSGGLSKWCGAGGWRLGTFTFPRNLRWLLDAMAVVASETYTSTSAPIQYAAVRAYQGGMELEDYLWQSRRILRSLGIHAWTELHHTGAYVPKPEGAFYVFPDFECFRSQLEARGIRTGVQFCERLLEDTGVAVLPGSAFGRPRDELSMRLSYVDFDGARALVGARDVPADQELDEPFLDAYCPSVMEAIDRIVNWVRL